MMDVRGSTTTDHTSSVVLPPLEMWAGIECTINRVGSHYRDQLAFAGHYGRTDDVDRLADLGVRTVRWPVLWERHAGDSADAWHHTDRALERLRLRGVEPIVGLVHHGSGPSHTNLLDPGFPDALAVFARRVAERYPWIRYFTPVNEPLTTARFSALYGLWYPHASSDTAFVDATITQMIAVQRAMAAIRRVTPDAKLVQTEDLGYSHSTPLLAYQAQFENERRWLTFDLLNGRVDRAHPLHRYLSTAAPVRSRLAELADTAADPAMRPAIHGINHYLTSERFLDERTASYPKSARGGNGRHRYVDVEAVRVLADGPLGPAHVIAEACERYGTPVAITEAHLACTREQQLRWLADVWDAAHEVRSRGFNVCAVTAWSALGAFDWRSLLTRDEGAYETGLYDLRAPAPRPTALATMVRALATTGQSTHPALQAERWWTRDDRLTYPARTSITQRRTSLPRHGCRRSAPPLLVTGAGGTLGRVFAGIADERGLACHRATRRDLDITDPRAVVARLQAIKPWAVVNAAGWVRVDDAEHAREECVRTNTHGAAVLAEACASLGIRYVTFSSDLVFGNAPADRAQRPRVESDRIAPLNVYGRSKADAERLVALANPEALVVRTSAFFGDGDDWNFVTRLLAELSSSGQAFAPDDAVVSPTYVPDLVHATIDLLIDGERGVWHLANEGAVTWYELAVQAAAHAGLASTHILPCSSSDIGWHAPRPAYAALASERGSIMPSLHDALQRYARSRAWERLLQTRAASLADVAAAGTAASETPPPEITADVREAYLDGADIAQTASFDDSKSIATISAEQTLECQAT